MLPQKNMRKKQQFNYSRKVLPSKTGGWKQGGATQPGFLCRQLEKIRSVLLYPGTKTEHQGEVEQRGRRIVILLALVIVCGYGGWRLLFFCGHSCYNYLTTAQILPVENVKIVGNILVSNQQINGVAQIIEHKTGMLSINSRKIQQELEKIDWVKSAKVKKNWPTSVIIEVEEECPLALIMNQEKGEQNLCYIDSQRRTFPASISDGRLDFPVITGLFSISDEGAREKALGEAITLLRKVRGNNPYLPLQSLSEIHFMNTGEMVIYLVEYAFPVFFGKGKVKQKYRRLVQVLKPLYKNHQGKKKIDAVSYIQMEYLKDKVLVATIEEKTGG